MKHKKSKFRVLFALAVLISQVFGSLLPIKEVFAADIYHPEVVTIEGSNAEIYHLTADLGDGRHFENHATSPLYAVYDGTRMPVFCIEPGVATGGTSTPGFEKNPLPSMSAKAKLISVLWKYAGTDTDTQEVASWMIWDEIVGLSNVKGIRPDGTPLDYEGIRAKINQVIESYKKQPSFNGSAIKLKIGESITLTDTNGVDLSSFDGVQKNTANVDYSINGNKLTITAKADSNESGILRFKKTKDEGTPVAYKKEGLQTVMAGAIDDPNGYQLPIEVIKNGDLKIVKRDKESGDLVPGTKFEVTFSDGTPKKTVTTGADGTVTLKDVAIDGTEVTVKEISVPAPYVVDGTTFKGKIVAGETIELTSRNMRQKGQIKIEKSGQETGTKPWNENYSLAGNEFQIRKDTQNGPIVATLTTDKDGKAETSSDVLKALELGKYWVVESKASAGFVNTFKPTQVELKYAGQTVELVINTLKGANQEVTGEATLTKEDKDTGSETQGNAVFDGAEYTLYYGKNVGSHKADAPVLWTDEYKPTLTVGTNSETPVTENAVTITLDENEQAGVSHLAIGSYYWRESKAPVGYTLDNTKYPVEIKKVDDSASNAVIKQDVTAKEQVIRFGFSFYKWAEGSSASAGVNGLEFKLTPQEGTKPITGGDATAVTGPNAASGLDGYGQFKNIPIGNYKFEETIAPEGFELITPLLINVKFNENEEDYAQSEYVFIITEEGKDHAVKTITVPYSELTNDAFTVSLNNLMLYDKEAGTNVIASDATWTNGQKQTPAAGETKLQDKVTYDLAEAGKSWYLVSKVVDVDATKAAIEKAEAAEAVVISTQEKEVKNKLQTGSWTMSHTVDTSKYANKTLVVYNYLYASKEAYDAQETPVAVDADLDSETQTVTVDEEKELHYAIGSDATWANGAKNTTAEGGQVIKDKVSYKLDEVKDWYLVADVIDVDATKAAQAKDAKAAPVVLSTQEKTVSNKFAEGNWYLEHTIDTKDLEGKTMVVFNRLFASEEAFKAGEAPVASDTDLNSETQTVTVDSEQNIVDIMTKAHDGKGQQTFTHGDVLKMYDDVKITNSLVKGQKQSFETILCAVTPDGKSQEIWKSDRIDYTADEKEFVKTVVTKEVDTSKYPEGTLFTFKEIHYDDEGKENGRHNDDLKEKSQTLYPTKTVTPEKSTPEKPTSERTTTPKQNVTTYPKAGEKPKVGLTLMGIGTLMIAGYLAIQKKKATK